MISKDTGIIVGALAILFTGLLTIGYNKPVLAIVILVYILGFSKIYDKMNPAMNPAPATPVNKPETEPLTEEKTPPPAFDERVL